ncbi:MAG: hypothetical protein GEV06_23295 [Luteitalea sp.]|nr:hypothetical protein [Luteitalea sp.]
MKRPASVSLMLLVAVCCIPSSASAQAVETTEGLSLRDTIGQLTQQVGSTPVGDAMVLATALEVATSPLGTTSSGFGFELDPNTGLLVRRATTFGPSFAERALTAGADKMAIQVSFSSATYDKLGDVDLDGMRLGALTGDSPETSFTGTTSLEIESQTLVLGGVMGITENIDVGVAVPLVKVRVQGLTEVVDGDGKFIRDAVGGGTSSGLGDIAVQAKYRFLRFGNGLPDPGGVALAATVRLPTGSSENLRGLGLYRALVSVLASAGRGRFRPHANVGFEWWDKGIAAQSGFAPVPDVETGLEPATSMVTVRHQFQYAAGVEFEAASRLTLLVDFLGRHLLDGGKVGFQAFTPGDDGQGVTSFESLVALPEGFQKLTLVPGLKWNIKGNLLFSVNALIPVQDEGLHDVFTPVVGLDWAF